MNHNIYHPKGMAYPKAPAKWPIVVRDALLAILFGLTILAIQGAMVAHDSEVEAKEQAAKALSLLQACMNGHPIMYKNDAGEVESFAVCSASKEIKL